MKKKTSRSGKAVKPAAQSLRRAIPGRVKNTRAKASPAQSKRSAIRKPKKQATPTQPRTAGAAKANRATKRVKLTHRSAPAPTASKPERKEIPGSSNRRPASRADTSEPSEAAGVSAEAQTTSPPPLDIFGLRIPPILLEGDEPTSSPITVPAQKSATDPSVPPTRFEPDEGALPESYGTGRLVLVARDPHWLYAQWDLTPQQQRHYNALSADHHLVVRLHSGAARTEPVKVVHVHPESRHWFIQGARAGTQYVAELGYYGPRQQWVRIADSPPTVTPPAAASTDQTSRFATVPSHVPLSQLESPHVQPSPAGLRPLEPALAKVLTEMAGLPIARQPGTRSTESVEGFGDAGAQEGIAAPGLPTSPGGAEAEHISSPMGPAGQLPAGFWLSVNAEIVLYGATEPDASVTIGGRPVEVRPDGTFSCRMSLPDGEHAITVSALSPLGDLRQAKLQFARRTEHCGEVADAAPDPSLEPPADGAVL